MEAIKNNIKKLQVVKFEVKKGDTFEFNGNTKTEHDRVKGIFLRLSNSQALQGATLRVWVDDTEIIPDDTEVALLHHSDDMSIQDVAFPLDEKAKNSPVRIIYKDNSENLAVENSYYVRVYLLAEVNK
jgi:P pilus assembly chaperone PapD